MSTKAKTVFECQSCGVKFPRWAGKCESCGSWNSIIEVRDEAASAPAGLTLGLGGVKLQFADLKGEATGEPRVSCGIRELDRVLGGGCVAGGVVLVGGDPGIGKSTILLQAAAHMANGESAQGPAGGIADRLAAGDGSVSKSAGAGESSHGGPAAGRGKVFYLTGEESVGQVKMRAARLGLSGAPVALAANSNIRDIAATLGAEPDVKAVVIDSIQTMYLDSIDSAPGTISQVRGSAGELIRLAKQRGFALFLIGHVTKEGAIAGPRVLEHMVDTVLYFEGERSHQFRILRSVKNRFGATDEIGVFEMTGKGLAEVENPSALFLAERRGNVSGSSVFAGIEGTRPILLEIQALVTPSNGGNARRAVVGWDSARLSMLTAVLDSRCHQEFYNYDIFLNVAGGLKIGEPAGDLAVAAALLSSKNNVPAPADMAIFGEVGLSGEIRAVASAEQRVKEAAKLGFARALVPRSIKSKFHVPGIKVIEAGHLQDLAALLSK
jgi:DNA repair protein RadA/Sms